MSEWGLFGASICIYLMAALVLVKLLRVVASRKPLILGFILYPLALILPFMTFVLLPSLIELFGGSVLPSHNVFIVMIVAVLACTGLAVLVHVVAVAPRNRAKS